MPAFPKWRRLRFPEAPWPLGASHLRPWPAYPASNQDCARWQLKHNPRRDISRRTGDPGREQSDRKLPVESRQLAFVLRTGRGAIQTRTALAMSALRTGQLPSLKEVYKVRAWTWLDTLSRLSFNTIIKGTNSNSHHLFHTHKDHFKGIYDPPKLIGFVQVNHVSFKKTRALAQAQGY